MKKFIAIALLLAMCLSLFAGCGGNGGETTPSTEPVNNLEKATDYVRAMYKDKAGKVLRSFDVVGTVNIGTTSFTVEWTTDASEEYIKIVPGDKTVTIEVVNAKPVEQINFTLTATVSDGAGKTSSTTLKYYIEAVEPEDVSAVFVDAPAVGTPYKYALVQATHGKTLYFTGEMDGYYLAMSEDPAAGVDVTVEAAEGGYHISFTKDGAKKYIDIIPREGAEGKVNVVIADAPTAVYTWDSERKTMTTTVNGGAWYLGTYGDYTTISASATSYIEDVSKIGVSQFPAGFATMGGAPAPVVVDTPVAGTAYKYSLTQANLGKVLYFTGAMDGYYLAMSENAAEGVDVVLEETEGGYHISFTKDGAKKYIDIIPREGAEGKVNVVIADAPTAVYTWDAERKTMITTVNGGAWYLGTYSEYVTISASATSYIEDVSKIGVSQFPAGFVTMGGASAPVTPAPDTGDKEEPEASEPEASEPEASEPETPATGVTDGQKVVIYNPGDAKYATGTEIEYTNSKGNTKMELELTTDKAAAVVLTVKVGANGNISFVTEDGKYLYCNGNDVKFVTEADENTEFVLEGSYIRCATANYQGKPQYLEVYSGYLTCYGMGTNTALYVFELQAA